MSRQTRHKRIRAKIKGTKKRPRLSVFRSLKYIYAQIINDKKGHTLAEAHGKDAQKVGKDITKKCLEQKIKKVVFDRGGYKYHGRVKKLAESARKAGLKF